VNRGSAPLALSCRGIVKRFGMVTAVDGVDFDVRAGEIHALVGENGAGKSTLMNVLYGVLAPDEGTIEVRGERVEFANCARAMEAGIGMVFQHYLLVERFSVADNVLLGCEPAVHGWVDRRAALSRVQELAARYRFTIDPSQVVETLGVGARQQVELLRVLGRAPQIVILDEPTAALSPVETEGLFAVMQRLREEGRAVIFITHKLKEVMKVCDRVTVLRRGRVVGTVNRTDADEAQLASMMVGAKIRDAARPRCPPSRSAPVILAIDGLSADRDGGGRGVFGLHLEARAGEIIGIAGVEGNGQLEFAEALYGIRPIAAGRVCLDGVDLTRASVPERRSAGLRYISPDRQREGLVLDFDAVENALLGDERFPDRGALLDVASGRDRADDIAREFTIDAYERTAPMRYYSGGTQQKFLVGRETAGTPRVVIAFAPTRGVDISAAQSIYDRLAGISAAGACILLISYDLDEIRALADRVLVFHGGTVAGELSIELADDASLGRLMTSGAL
jgi:general nucleoside transport system ATP-binding protein